MKQSVPGLRPWRRVHLLHLVGLAAATIGLMTGNASAQSSEQRERWVSAWGKCADEDQIVRFLSAPANRGAFKSLFMYGLVGIHGGNVTYDDMNIRNCTARINALGVLVEPILGISPLAALDNMDVQERAAADLVAVGHRHGFYGYATDIEGPHKSARGRLLKIFRGIHDGLKVSSPRIRFAPFIDYSTVYDDWPMYIPVTDRILDGMCYKSESEQAFFSNCRASARPNASVNHAHTGHLGAAFLSPATPGKKGHWGYSASGARTRVQAVIDAGAPEIGMFNLIGTAHWWPPLLRQFLSNVSRLAPAPPPPPCKSFTVVCQLHLY